ncbi:MAG: aminopeptidase P family protein [Alphaproteobacteria bacterium]
MAAFDGLEQGDSGLTALLRAAGSVLDAKAVGALASGVAAAPGGVDPDGWMVLVADDPPPALRDALRAVLAETRAAADDGLGVSPAPPARLGALRERLAKLGVDGFVVPLTDEHQSEFPPGRARRLAWLTGFTGSAGMAMVLPECAAVFVDGRYTLQVRDQVETGLFEPRHQTEQPPGDWLAEHATEGMRIGFDPWLHTADGVRRLETACAKSGALMVALDENPVDAVWPGQPAPPLAPVVPHPFDYAGSDSAEKRSQTAAALRDAGADAAVLSAPDSIAWLLNIRGGDVPNAPLALGFAILGADASVRLFIDPRKLTEAARRHLGDAVTVEAPEALEAALDALGTAGVAVQAAPGGTPAWITNRLKGAGARLVDGADPCVLPKACKNTVELQGARNAHIRDGAALTRFLAWLAREAPSGNIDELSATERLLGFRAAGELFRGLSFDTISGAGPNGAIVHYHSTPATNRKLEPGTLYLVDSGAQYLDGTTDVTRTVAIGEPSAEMRDRFTRVLKGHIAIASARFPAGTGGGQLDTLARHALWQIGLDFDHGTGHGVGSYLCVHEGPQRIAKRLAEAPIRPGMIVSNEPGYYKTGAYGIRIENLEMVRAAPADDGAERDMLCFEALTLAPIDRALVETKLMTGPERAWLDAYHARVRDTLTPLVDNETAEWLAQATAAI